MRKLGETRLRDFKDLQMIKLLSTKYDTQGGQGQGQFDFGEPGMGYQRMLVPLLSRVAEQEN